MSYGRLLRAAKLGLAVLEQVRVSTAEEVVALRASIEAAERYSPQWGILSSAKEIVVLMKSEEAARSDVKKGEAVAEVISEAPEKP